MAEKALTKDVKPSSSTAKSPDSDVSPGTSAPSKSRDYFGIRAGTKKEVEQIISSGQDTRHRLDAPQSSNTSTAPSTSTSVSTTGPDGDSRWPSYADGDGPKVISRKSSSASVSFRAPRNPSLPQGLPRKTDNRRLRESSPSPVKFRSHVGFDNLPVGEATKNNTSSFTLHVRHQGYQPSRRSRTFMVGVDEHAYSDYALVWLLNNMVDDGDEVVCVRVLENPPKTSATGDKNYQDDAKRLLQAIQDKNDLNKAISIILEYSVGKLHATFQQLLHIYQPSMLVVGTKGRSLGGIQGLMNTRNSFSKYCLQYSPVPVVVVRPDDKRLKKKDKRAHDPSRQSYAAMLAHNSGKHEADSEASSLFELEKGISPDEEAHKVAAAIGLPAAFDPTIKPYHSPLPTLRSSSSNVNSPPSGARSTSPPPPALTNDSGDDESGDDEDEYEIEAVSAQQLLRESDKRAEMEREQKRRLHAMEVGEAAALLKSGKSKEEEEEDDDDDSVGRATKDPRKA